MTGEEINQRCNY